MSRCRFLGFTVLPEFVQNETIDRVPENLVRMGATAVATSPYVMDPADAQSGSREPPDDAGAGNVRLLEQQIQMRRTAGQEDHTGVDPNHRPGSSDRRQKPLPQPG